MAHITGGGFIDNVPRILPDGLQARIDTASWRLPTLFARLVEWGHVPQAEAYRVWNMGVGMVLVVRADAAAAAQVCLPEATVIGRLATRSAGAPAVELI